MKPTSILRTLATLVLAATLLPAQAALLQFDFSTTVSSGPLAGQQGSGFIRFDDAFAGNASVSPADGGLQISFSFDGQTFTEANDQDSPNFPLVTLFDGLPVAIDFFLLNGASGVAFANPSIASIALQGSLLPGANGLLIAPIEVEIGDVQAVPEPATYALVGLALLGLALNRRATKR